MDFDDLLLQTNILLRDCPDVTARYQEQFKYILVDEYQDTNYAQYVIIRRLSQLHSKVCVVGDDAPVDLFVPGGQDREHPSFKKDFPNAMIFKLEQNYRSTRTIVEAANSVIERNSKRMEKKCFSEGDMGEKIRVLRAYTDREEAEMVVSDLRDKVRAAGDEWAEAAILYRTNNQSQALEDALRRKGIPYRIYKAIRSTTTRRSRICWPISGWLSTPRRRGLQADRQLPCPGYRRYDRRADRFAGQSS